MEDKNEHSFGSMYSLGEEVGRGGCAHIYRCVHRSTGSIRVVKISSSESAIKHAINEAKIISRLKSKVFPKMFDVFEQDGKVFEVMEFCKGMSFHTYLVKNAPLQERCTLIIGRQIFEALNYLHSMSIAHLDIKPENIIIDPATLSIKLIDFGFACECAEQCNTFNGSLHYAAPELFIKKPYNAQKADIWSAGIILYTMATGSLPFAFSEYNEHIKSIFKREIRPLPKCTGDICKTLIENSIVINPDRRITAGDALKILDDVNIPRCLKAISYSMLPRRSKIICPSHVQRSHAAILSPCHFVK